PGKGRSCHRGAEGCECVWRVRWRSGRGPPLRERWRSSFAVVGEIDCRDRWFVACEELPFCWRAKLRCCVRCSSRHRAGPAVVLLCIHTCEASEQYKRRGSMRGRMYLTYEHLL
ncbi:unnamed protein product, partial [Ectocarpus sp. 4 AP-2014]